MEKDQGALKKLGMIANRVAWGGGLDVSVTSDNVTEDGHVTEEALAALTGAETIVKLSFSFGQQFSDKGAEQISGFTHLEELALSDTKVTDAGLAHLKGMTELKVFSLDGTEITDAGLTHLAGMPMLEDISLSTTAVTDAGLAHLKGLSNLKAFRISGTRFTPQNISGAGLAHLQLGNLERLQMNNSKVTGGDLALLSESKNLRVIWAAGCDISDEDLEHLQDLKLLSTLYLQGTKVTDAGLDHLGGLPELSLLDVDNTSVTRERAAKFQEARPGCSIHGDGWKIFRQ